MRGVGLFSFAPSGIDENGTSKGPGPLSRKDQCAVLCPLTGPAPEWTPNLGFRLGKGLGFRVYTASPQEHLDNTYNMVIYSP